MLPVGGNGWPSSFLRVVGWLYAVAWADAGRGYVLLCFVSLFSRWLLFVALLLSCVYLYEGRILTTSFFDTLLLSLSFIGLQLEIDY
jgi:hypothetical protein